jgi:hypothetical protein
VSTKFGILTEQVEHEKLVDKDGDLLFYISKSIFEPVFFRSNGGKNCRWLFNYGPLLNDETKVYALDNTQQGIYTIGDIKKYLENGSKK